MENFNAEKVTNAAVKWIQDWFELNGKGCNAVSVFRAVKIRPSLPLCAQKRSAKTVLSAC